MAGMNVESITSRHNPRVKQAVKLRERRQRENQGRFLIDGLRELSRAAAAGIELEEFFFCPAICSGSELASLLKLLSPRVHRLEITPEVHRRLAYGERAEGVLGVARTPQRVLAEFQLPELPLVAVLEGVEKPGNLGAVLRSADAAGVSALIVTGEGTDLYNPNVVRASLGTLFTVPVFAASSEETLAWLREKQLHIYAARVDATLSYTVAKWNEPAAIVLGSEAHGLTSHWHAGDISAIRLPMLGTADSLNVSATASVLFYEALRQRTLEFKL
jgi:TrmH family RNA methyltransferase